MSAGRNDGPPPAERPGYEQARDELVEIVRRLEAGGVTLEESLELWERGEQLAKICQDWLDGARERLETAARPTDASAE
jgi:exodeoxyribonuclease VII small subunit